MGEFSFFQWLQFGFHIILLSPTDPLTPGLPELVIRQYGTNYIEFTWGDASGAADFNRYFVSIDPVHGRRTGSIEERQVIYIDLTPGTYYTIRVEADGTSPSLIETITQQTSKSCFKNPRS